MAQSGLTNKDNKPAAGQCKNGHETGYEWKQHGTFGFWGKPDCMHCADDKTKAAAASALERRFDSTRVPKLLRGIYPDSLGLDKFNQHLHQIIAEWMPPNWLAIGGPVGTGKTTWATALFNSLVRQGGDWGGGIWTTESELFETCDIAHADHGYTGRQKALRRFVTCPLLLIDDIGAGRSRLTEWQGSSMRHLFDVRHANGLPTLLTTNLGGPAAFADRYGKHVASRVLQATNGFAFLGGPDRRLNDIRGA